MNTLFSDGGDDDEKSLPPPRDQADALKMYEGGPWVVRCQIKRGGVWYYPRKDDPARLSPRLELDLMETHDDPFVAEGQRLARQYVSDRQKSKHKHEVASFETIRAERQRGVY